MIPDYLEFLSSRHEGRRWPWFFSFCWARSRVLIVREGVRFKGNSLWSWNRTKTSDLTGREPMTSVSSVPVIPKWTKGPQPELWGCQRGNARGSWSNVRNAAWSLVGSESHWECSTLSYGNMQVCKFLSLVSSSSFWGGNPGWRMEVGRFSVTMESTVDPKKRVLWKVTSPDDLIMKS